MDDLISREAAIDAFKKELTVGESKGNYVTICSAVGYTGAKQILESLPSAQPHWIPVTERLPENGQIVLAYTDWEECRVMKRNESIWDNQREQLRYFWEEQSSEMLDYEKDTVIAWMELPEPYKEET